MIDCVSRCRFVLCPSGRTMRFKSFAALSRYESVLLLFKIHVRCIPEQTQVYML
jgi:hypothetical protein